MADQSVVIIGAGSVGLITALGLARSGVTVTVLEESPVTATALRDSGYHFSVLDGLDELGVLSPMLQAGMRAPRWSYRVLRSGEVLTFDISLLADDIERPFNLHVNQAAMVDILVGQLAQLPGAEVVRGIKVTALAQDADGVTLMGVGPDGARTYRAGWVVGADGAHSVVRRELGLALAGSTWPDRLVANDVDFDFGSLGSEFAGYQVDHQHGAVLAREVNSDHWRYIFSENRLLPEDTVDQRVGANLAAAVPAGEAPEVVRSMAYRIHERSVDRLRGGRMLLVGDAAHLTNPAAGCGMTSGLFDAFALTEGLAAVINDGAPEAVLDRYSEARRQNFFDYASAYSCQVKNFVFHTGTEQRMADEVDRYRRITSDPDRAREYLRMTAGGRTPSVLSAIPSVDL